MAERTLATGHALKCALLVLLAAGPGTQATAQGKKSVPPDIGHWEYANQCAVCHGEKGQGDGPLAKVLTRDVPALTHLKKNNGGTMPVEALTEIIDGRRMVAGHGSREMPIWGKRLGEQARYWLGPDASEKQVRAFVQGRIRALIKHIESLQQK